MQYTWKTQAHGYKIMPSWHAVDSVLCSHLSRAAYAGKHATIQSSGVLNTRRSAFEMPNMMLTPFGDERSKVSTSTCPQMGWAAATLLSVAC